MKLDFDTKQYIDEIRKNENYFHTFINRDTLAAGVLVLQPGEEDTQTPHDSDEVYYVVKGDGFLKINKKDYLFQKVKCILFKKTLHIIFLGTQKNSLYCIFLVAQILRKLLLVFQKFLFSFSKII